MLQPFSKVLGILLLLSCSVYFSSLRADEPVKKKNLKGTAESKAATLQNPFVPKTAGQKPNLQGNQQPGQGNGMMRQRLAELNQPLPPATPQEIQSIANKAQIVSAKKDKDSKPLPDFGANKPDLAAKKINDLLKQEIFSKSDAVASTSAESVTNTTIIPQPLADDSTYLRRVYLDLIGRTPTPEEITAFSLDASNTKRSTIVQKLLANKEFGENWSHYWRDVIMYRRSEDRALIAAEPLQKYLAEEFNKNTSWDKIARSFITASGKITEEGDAALFMAQMGDTEDVTSEISRIFMGVQIQCAQCHNHPTDRWKREQFHELAAFFPRTAIRPGKMGDIREYELVSVDRERPFRGPDNGKPRGSTEHFMPDLKDPGSKGARMEPVFFVTGKQLPVGTTDSQRRGVAAIWMTGKENPWFARAFVNRLWSELTGEGFSEPIDDIGPDRQVNAPKTFEYLAAEFQANHYDIKWLMQAIMQTEAYQRVSQSRRNSEQTPFTANVAQRLRGDQLYSALTSVFDVNDFPSFGPTVGKGPYARNARNGFNFFWGYDPSVRRDEVASSISQALGMMNGAANYLIRGNERSGTVLAKILKDNPKNEDAAIELYLRCLSREPKTDEVKTCLDHVKSAKSRSEGFEDIMWALVNSTEFLHRK